MYDKLIIFGDSITWGADDPEGLGWANRIRKKIDQSDSEMVVYNLGIRGDTSNGILKRFELESELIGTSLNSCLVFAIGINDSRFVSDENTEQTPIADFKKNISEIIIRAKKITQNIIFIGLTDIIDDRVILPRKNQDRIYIKERIRTFDQIVKQMASENKLKYISMNGVLEKSDFYQDGLHPNASGHEKMFNKIATELNI